MTSWQNPLYVWVRDFLSLKTLPLHGNVIVQRDEEELVPRGAADGRYRLYLERSLEGYRKERSLREVYLQCGWRVDADGEMQQGQGGRVWESLEEARKVAGGGFQPREFEIRRQEWFDRLWPEDAREKCSGCLEH
ncbi:hypothetical protein BO70DRAFT_361568 [Aspergillus heteromorphus CBS 117.55]|uniref:Uncharacterized protein n=1 Tax=Aspergillus heteromorphus CBS 117.55 TaxID=1448321 RepID=A0A317WEK8_9EURO|nr:uncharacterized protein BO70DRAFT_361568 [Aspergillus heteromorphus CBS 117.55]PWY83448.1 hypothetical protein BO70DRAFT_361568 [Aspergillus heteromorphus CBS 117.55]